MATINPTPRPKNQLELVFEKQFIGHNPDATLLEMGFLEDHIKYALIRLRINSYSIKATKHFTPINRRVDLANTIDAATIKVLGHSNFHKCVQGPYITKIENRLVYLITIKYDL